MNCNKNNCNINSQIQNIPICLVPGPIGTTERLFKSSNRIIIDSS